MNKKSILLIIGPSGSGKTTIVNRLHKDGIVELHPTWTTRPMREGERNGIEHLFVSDKEFNKAATNDVFLMVRTPFGLQYHYGLPKLPLEHDKPIAVMLRADVCDEFLSLYPDAATYQFFAPPEVVAQRMQQRNDDSIGTRITQYQIEVEAGGAYADRIFDTSKDFDEVYEECKKAILSDFTVV